MLQRIIPVLVAVLVLNWMGVLEQKPSPAPSEAQALPVLDVIQNESVGEAGGPAAPDRVPGELLVDLRDDATDADVAAIEQRFGIDLQEIGPENREVRVMRAEVGDRDEAALTSELSKDGLVEQVEPNYLYRSLMVPNDPLYKYQWHMDQIRCPKAWDGGKYGEGAVVAVIDTGVAFENYRQFKKIRDLQGTKFVPGYNAVAHNDHPNDDHSHGTHVAGTVAQTTNNKEGVAGIAFKCAIMPIKVLTKQGWGTIGEIAEGIRWAADHKANVINMSLGGNSYSRVLKEACDYAKKKGVTIVCAAGNNGREGVSYPARYPACIAVSATRFDETLTWYSNWGKEICVAAPGGDTRVDQNGDGYPDGVLQNTIKPENPGEDVYALFQGTSMASPHVAGVAALIVSQGVKNPDKVRAILEKTARPKGGGRGDPKFGAGIVDAAAAQKAAAAEVGNRRLLSLVGAALLVACGLSGAALRLVAAAVPAVAAGCGFYFLPWQWLPAVLTQPMARWELAIFPGDGAVSPIFYSALLPLLAVALLWGFRPARPVTAGLALGFAAHLADAALLAGSDVAWPPGTAGALDVTWLLANAVALFVLARLALKGCVAR